MDLNNSRDFEKHSIQLDIEQMVDDIITILIKKVAWKFQLEPSEELKEEIRQILPPVQSSEMAEIVLELMKDRNEVSKMESPCEENSDESEYECY